MQNFQLLFFYDYFTFAITSNFYRKYDALFSVLDLTGFPDKNTEVEQTTHYKLRSVKNQMTIAHLSQSLIALAAVQLQRPEKIRCYRTFAQAS